MSLIEPSAELFHVGMGSFGGLLIGFPFGFYKGYRLTSLQYTAQNAHHRPTSSSGMYIILSCLDLMGLGWFLYHRRKNYKSLLNATKSGVLWGARFSSLMAFFFSIDVCKFVVDFFNIFSNGLRSSCKILSFHIHIM